MEKEPRCSAAGTDLTAVLTIVGLWTALVLPAGLPGRADRFQTQQDLPAVTPVFDVGGMNAAAGVELAAPSAVLLEGERLWIADEGQHRVIVVDRSTGVSREFGRWGQGPGEFQNLEALSCLSDGRVAVLDRINLRISIFMFSAGELSFEKSLPLGMASPWSLCSDTSRIMVVASFHEKILHALDESGQVLHSFGEPFRTENELFRMGLGNRSRLVCLEQTDPRLPNTIVAATEWGTIRAYSPDGHLLWVTSPPDFRPIDVSPAPRGGITYRMPPEGSYHLISSVLPIDEKRKLLVQVARIGEGGRQVFEEITSHVLMVRTGELISSSHEIPRLDSIGNGYAAGIENAEYALVRVYRITGTFGPLRGGEQERTQQGMAGSYQ